MGPRQKSKSSMKKIKIVSILLLLLSTFLAFSQQKTEKAKIKISGTVIEKNNKLPLEYATITLKNTKDTHIIFGGISDKKGDFSIAITPGIYDVIIEFISLKSQVIKQRSLTENTNIGIVTLEEDITQLNEVVVRSNKTTVEIKLDKKVYNVGQDLMVKGGTVSDVLDNVPSVSVDVDGSVSLRGNNNVRILIDGKPSTAIDINEALRLIPADAIEKVEVITNPSARYDAEGGAGILNIILKKGKNKGLNGNVVANLSYPEVYGLNGTANFKSKSTNLFTTQGYTHRTSPGNGMIYSRYLNEDNSTKNYMNEDRDNNRIGNSYNGLLGMDWFLSDAVTWTNTFSYRTNNGTNESNVYQNYYDSNYVYDYTRTRINLEDLDSKNLAYTTNFTKNFKKEGHKLTFDGTLSSNEDLNNAVITDTSTSNSDVTIDETVNNQTQKRTLVQSDYVLPLAKGSQFEAGYKGDFGINTTDYSVIRNGVPFPELTNILEYKQKINALYSQYGFKKNKLSTLLGLRMEASDIDINQLATNDYNNKKYQNLFPSAFFTYEFKDQTSCSLNYSRRIQRPNERQLNPFNNFSSNVNIYVGNPDLDPSLTDAIDFAIIKRWDKLTFNSSVYANKTDDVIQMVRKETGISDNGTPIIITTPINLAKEYRGGFEFTLNYNPYKWWKLNGNFNFFYIETDGDYTYTDYNGNEIYQNFDFSTTSWSTRITSKVNLPGKIDWQTNLNYTGDQENAQGSLIGVFSMNLAFSKDVLKDRGTLNLNVNDVFNSKKRKFESYLPGAVDSYGEMQFKVRTINLAFTYRFNMQKNEKERKPRNGQPDDGSDFPGGQ